MKKCKFLMEITKKGAQSLQIKTVNKCCVVFERSYIYYILQLARTSLKVGNTRLLPLVLLRAQDRISEQACNLLLVG